MRAELEPRSRRGNAAFATIIICLTIAALVMPDALAARRAPRNATPAGSPVEVAPDNRLDPSWPKRVVIIADSVMLSAKPAVIKSLAGWQVSFEGRPALMISKAVEDLRRRNVHFAPIVVVALGYNSLWQPDRKNFQMWSDRFDKSVENMLALLKERGARKVVWVLLRELTPDLLPSGGVAQSQYRKYAWYFPYVNERLRAIKQGHPELVLADWAAAARRPGVTYDAIHTNVQGGELMAQVVKAAIGIDPGAATPAGAAANVPEAERKRPAEQPRSPEAEQPPTGVAAPAPPPAAKPAAAAPLKQNYSFRDCATCPEMVVVPAGSFMMGTPESEGEANENEGPARSVTIARPFAVGKFEVTFAQWEACVAGGGCQGNPSPGDEGWGKGGQPVINVSWYDALEYVAWLSRITGKPYRLLTEAEWEYAARAGTTSSFSTGVAITSEQANFQTRDGQYRERAIAVGSFAPNPWELHDMHGNVSEWVQDNWHENYADAPADGSAWVGGDTTRRVLRGGSWYTFAPDIRSASRRGDLADYRSAEIGFRVGRGL
jgi:formylglycine-generating enzyme required for sulfatase activity